MTPSSVARSRAVLATLVLSLAVALPVRAQAAPFAPVSGNWDRHGFGLTVNDDGSASAVWRVYRWCGPGVPRPCDQIVDNQILSGGHADITFSGPDENGDFVGEVTRSSDPELLELGPLRMMPQAFDMAQLEQGAMQLTLCGEDAVNLAPQDVLEECGASPNTRASWFGTASVPTRSRRT